jgi:hypothetical protein
MSNESIQRLYHEEEEHGGQWVSLPEAPSMTNLVPWVVVKQDLGTGR